MKDASSSGGDRESSSSSGSLPGFPAVDKDIMIKPASSVPVSETELQNGGSSPSAIRGVKGAGRSGGKKSSFERVLEKLTPIYPDYTR